MDLLGLGRPKEQAQQPLSGASYLATLHKYLLANFTRLAPPRTPSEATWLQQSYTLLTLGLDPNSAPLSDSLKVPLTLGFATPGTASPARSGSPSQTSKPLVLRLPPDRLLYLLLRWQSLPQGLKHVGRTDEPIAPGVPIGARGARVDGRLKKTGGDVESVRSWVGSMRSVSLGSMRSTSIPGFGWLRKEEMDEDKVLLALYAMFKVLPALLIHPPFESDRPIAELVDAGGYTPLGGIDVRVPLDVLRNLQILELEGYDPRGLLIPPNHLLRSLTVRNVQDADDWLQELVMDIDQPRFPNLRHLSIHKGSLLDFPSIPLTSLTHLDLSHNLLQSLPSALSAMHSLQSINLSDNVIVSLRSAPAVLGNVSSLNLARNRISCLIGLERVLGLERVDLRGNKITQWDEVGRLSVLPLIKEVWCSDNPFEDAQEGEEWRINLGVAFAMDSRRQVVFDDRPWSWGESRRIEGELVSRGYGTNAGAAAVGAGSVGIPPLVASTPAKPSPSVPPTPVNNLTGTPAASTFATPQTVASTQATPSSAQVNQKKRRPRRVINLDEEGAPEDAKSTNDNGKTKKKEKKGNSGSN